MSEIMEMLKRLDTRLARIELSVSKPHLNEVLLKTHYSTADVAELEQALRH